MLCRHLPKLGNYEIILASSSPRRQSLLKDNLSLTFTVMVPNFEENIDKSTCSTPSEYVSQTSKMKCLEILAKQSDIQGKPRIIISADTIVVNNNEILEKPLDNQSAIKMLTKLSGSSHQVMTAVTIAIQTNNSIDYNINTFCELSNVHFADLSEETIVSYVASGEPMDKAGSYGIQGLGSSLVHKIDGCYFNVVGFPINRFCRELVQQLELN